MCLASTLPARPLRGSRTGEQGPFFFVGPLSHLSRARCASIITRMAATETIEIQATPEMKRQLEAEAARLNLSLSAYILYLHARLAPGRDAARLDRHVREVFGNHGELIRRLAK